MLRKKQKPRKVLRVRVQHEQIDNGAVEGLWVGEYQGYLHLRAVKLVFEGKSEAFRHDEILLPASRIIYMEVLGSDANPEPSAFEVGGAA